MVSGKYFFHLQNMENHISILKPQKFYKVQFVFTDFMRIHFHIALYTE